MEYKIEKSEIRIFIPASNKGKFRFKNRVDNFEFGNILATRSGAFGPNTYLEWQIGYDATDKDMKDGKKNTKLTHLTFVGANSKKKYPYELSELLDSAIKINLINKESLKKLLEKIKDYKNYLSDKKIEAEQQGTFELNGLSFAESSIKLPTFFLPNEDGTQIEVSIQKQQYASGVQPMLYFAIPCKSFSNGGALNGKSSTLKDKFIYIINKENVKNILRIFEVFAMASPSHNHDVREIIKALLAA